MPNENLKNPDLYTEIEIDKLSVSSKKEIKLSESPLLSIKKNQIVKKTNKINSALNKPLYGMTLQQYKEGFKYHNKCFNQLKKINLY